MKRAIGSSEESAARLSVKVAGFGLGLGTMKLVFLVIMSLSLASCSLIGSIGYLLKEQDFVVSNPQFSSFQWVKDEHPLAASLYERAEQIDGLSSLLVVQNGALIAEWYARGFDQEHAVNLKSASKSIISALVGIAIREGFLRSIDQPVSELLSEYFPSGEQEKQNITIKHLLTMSAGFDYSENQDNHVYAAGNWTRRILELPLRETPGADFRYGTIQTHLLSAVLTEAGGMDTLTFAQKYLFDPMGISIRRWKRAPDGTFFGGSQMYLTPRDMAAFGQLYLERGNFDGLELIPPAWVDRSTEPVFQQVRKDTGYGYSWWVKSMAGYNVYYAEGYGNQMILNVPDKDMVIVFTADTPLFYDFEARELQIHQLIVQKIFPLTAPPEKGPVDGASDLGKGGQSDES